MIKNTSLTGQPNATRPLKVVPTRKDINTVYRRLNTKPQVIAAENKAEKDLV